MRCEFGNRAVRKYDFTVRGVLFGNYQQSEPRFPFRREFSFPRQITCEQHEMRQPVSIVCDAAVWRKVSLDLLVVDRITRRQNFETLIVVIVAGAFSLSVFPF